FDPDPVLSSQRIKLAQRSLGPAGVTDDREAAALAALYRPAQSRLGSDPAEEGLTAGGTGRVLRSGAGLERDNRGGLGLLHASGSVRAVNPEQVREREARWALPAALAAFFAVVLMLLPGVVSSVSGSHEAEVLRSIDAHGGSVTLSSILQAGSFLLLAIPLVYLFQAARARSGRV